MTVSLGAAFLIPSGTHHNPTERHMFVVCTNVNARGEVVLASISSWKNDLCDPTCKLEPGCHPFIRRPSYVLYRKSRIELSADIERGVEQSVIVPLERVSSEMLGHVVDGIAKSRQTPWKVKRHIK
jgi:hypothetical protein